MDTLSRDSDNSPTWAGLIGVILILVLSICAVVGFMSTLSSVKKDLHTVTQYSVSGEVLGQWKQVHVRYETNGRCAFTTRDGTQITITQPYMTIREKTP